MAGVWRYFARRRTCLRDGVLNRCEDFQPQKDKNEEAARDWEIPNPAITGDNLESSRRQKDVYFRALIEHACDIISTFDAQGIRLYTSPSIERYLVKRVKR